MKLRVYIGYDEREKIAYDVAEKTARAWGCDVIPLYEERLRYAGLLTRPTDRRGSLFDLNSNAPMSTDFALSRFWVPILAHSGWCLFGDSDIVFLEDPLELMVYADPRKALHCVKHKELTDDGIKMRGQEQTIYARKNWSSIVLWNCDHPANKRINISMLNQWPGRDLHAMKWLADEEIGELPAEANWLVGIQPKPERPLIAHFTQGTPNMPGLEDSDHADIWKRAAAAA